MKANKKRSLLSGLPSWGLATLTFIATIILVIIVFSTGNLMKINENILLTLFYIIYGLSVAVCCFFIVRQNPKSIWYAPIICNMVGIFAIVWETEFWRSFMWMLICGGWVLSIMASIIGYRIGRRALSDDVNAAA